MKNPIKAGDRFVLDFGERNQFNGKIEIRGVVDDKIVYWYTRRKRHIMESIGLLDMLEKAGHLKKVKR